MFTIPMFKITKIWIQPSTLPTDRMDKESEEHVHNGIFWSKRKNEALLFGAT
jgi:hypothetical protein